MCQICQFQAQSFLEKKVTAYKSSFQATVDSDILSKLIVPTGAGYILRVRSRFKRNPPLVEREGESFNFQELHHQNYQNAWRWEHNIHKYKDCWQDRVGLKTPFKQNCQNCLKVMTGLEPTRCCNRKHFPNEIKWNQMKSHKSLDIGVQSKHRFVLSGGFLQIQQVIRIEQIL